MPMPMPMPMPMRQAIPTAMRPLRVAKGICARRRARCRAPRFLRATDRANVTAGATNATAVCSYRPPAPDERLTSVYDTMKNSAHPHAPAEIAVQAMPDDERVWVPQASGVWFRPLMLNTLQGQWCNLLRVRKSGVLSRHLHPSPVHGYVIKGKWKYREHDWTAVAGSYVFEPPGEIHTLEVPSDCTEMVTFFNISGAMIYLDDENRQIGYEDVFTKADMCRRHYAASGLGADYVDQFIR